MLYDILPVSDLRNKFPLVSEICLSKNKPVILTKNGKGSMVLVSLQKFEEQQNEIEIMKIEIDRLKNVEKQLVAVEEIYGGLLESEIKTGKSTVIISHDDFAKKMKERFFNGEQNKLQSSL